MITCKRCKRKFYSEVAYGIHTWMVRKDGRKKVCPSDDRLRNAGMSMLSGQWLFQSDEQEVVEYVLAEVTA